MNKQILLTLILIAFISAIFAQKKSDDGFDAFWKTFKTALAKDDKIAIANLTEFPILSNERKDEIANKEEFFKLYNSFFSKKQKKWLLNHEPIKSIFGAYLLLLPDEKIYCFYEFQKINNQWKFVGHTCK